MMNAAELARQHQERERNRDRIAAYYRRAASHIAANPHAHAVRAARGMSVLLEMQTFVFGRSEMNR
jgi:hypothetical protein